ncbi:ABC transporter permease [Sphingomonas sp. NFR15]|uniref:ABC transporter permease n=1 Tax=Sphingomonas sp. NFR15 TaxID=1566282 RepID=UPI000B818F0D|nr:ABC transporter permease [Sphingomonas sp. NFR15]
MRAYLTQVHAVTAAEVMKLAHDPMDLVTRAVQPILWLLLFGQVMAQVHGLTNGSYLDFLSPGVLAQSVLFVAIFYGLSAIWERDLGILHRYMVSPAPRSALVIGKAIASSARGITQGIVIYACAALLGVKLSFAPANLLGVLVMVFIASALFSTFSLIIACIVKTRERFMGIGQFLTMPIFFASDAIYPIELMPPWLRAIAHFNPLTYEVDGLRALMLTVGRSHFPLTVDYGAPVMLLALLIALASRMYPRLTE